MPFPAPWRSSAPGGPAADFYSLGPTDEFRGDGPGIGKPAPDFALTTPDGDVIRLSDFTGKIVVLNFWATWCTPCRKEFPELVRAHDPSGGVVVIGVDLQENPSEVLAFAREYGAQYPIVIDTDGSVADSYRLVGLPSTYFIDRAGILRAQQFGQLTQDLIRQRVAAAGAP